MIRLESIQIRNFRGIRKLDLTFAGRNFALHGPNGSGKSGVVDAIEFALTGAISRLAGPGAGGLSTQKHGPHVDYRDKARESSVVLEVTIQGTGKTATITRSPSTPHLPTITPDDKPTVDLLARVAKHPEFVLSRREIIKYILERDGAHGPQGRDDVGAGGVAEPGSFEGGVAMIPRSDR